MTADTSTLPERLRLRRLADRTNADAWRRYAVERPDGRPVGMVVEDHEWTGAGWGPRRWDVAHVRQVHQTAFAAAAPACWVSHAHRTRAAALVALEAHLRSCPLLGDTCGR